MLLVIRDLFIRHTINIIATENHSIFIHLKLMVCTIQSFCFLYKKRTLGLKKNQVGLSTNDPGYRKGSFYFFQPSDGFYISILRVYTIKKNFVGSTHLRKKQLCECCVILHRVISLTPWIGRVGKFSQKISWTFLQVGKFPLFFLMNPSLEGTTSKKHVIFSDIVTIAFDPHPPQAKSDMINQ